MLTQTLLNRALVLFSLVFVFSSCSTRKTGYVDLFKLVNEFELQKEYLAQAKREVDKQRSLIDSVVFAEKLKNPASAEKLKNELYTSLYAETQKADKEMEGMIWKRLNPYVEDFGKENGYQYIYGANGTGNVLYADKAEEITDELIKYVNKRYHDKK